ncbi:hypothetical protein Ac42p067 [Acinetobacter phage Ac42]|uniref:hypothetical protein n=1 Tax=Acinetobacter phage Ac42 TaxID=762660 RepID=UPI0001EBCCDD|nr:hypothetical protein Ac42p067 [Acinetobacter phage Ac42]ADI96305.1 hypothetical protein Ac42p067 [Acinetobacter phage Ac42]
MLKIITIAPPKNTKVYYHDFASDRINEMYFNNRELCQNLLRFGLLHEDAQSARIYRQRLIVSQRNRTN